MLDIKKIAREANGTTGFMEGVSYGVKAVKIPLLNGRTLLLCQGDAEEDVRAEVLPALVAAPEPVREGVCPMCKATGIAEKACPTCHGFWFA
jgi:hypothetical protein